MNDLNHKTALVTGGSKGLGRGIVEELAAIGVSVGTGAGHQCARPIARRELTPALSASEGANPKY